MIIGLGKTGKDILNYIEAEEVVAGVRTPEKYDDKDFNVLDTESALRKLKDIDLLFTATSSEEYVVDGVELPEVVFDLANPRDINPELLEDVESFNLDDLEEIVEETFESRDKEIEKVEEIIKNEMKRLKTEYKHMKAESAISTIQEKSHELKEQKVERLFNKIDGDKLDEDVKSEIRSMTDSLVNQLMAPPTISLKRAAETEDWEALDTAVRIFGRGKISENSSDQLQVTTRNKKSEI